MNENENPSPDQNLPDAADNETQRMPEQSTPGPAPAPASASASAPEPTTAKTKGRKRALLIGAAVVGLLAVGGSAYAIGANVGDDDDDDRPVAVDSSDARQNDDGDDRDDLDDRDASDADGRTDDDDQSSQGSQGSSTGLPASDAASLRAAAQKAIDSAGAKGVTSIDVERTGYEIEVQLADGSERDLLVAVDGTITTDADSDDDRADPLLDLDELADIQKAALAAAPAGGQNAMIDSISSSDDQGVAYEISIRLPDGRDADVELSSDLSVVTVDVDD